MANLSAFGGAQPIAPGGLVELGYSQITSQILVSSTSFASPTTVVAPLTVVCDGSPVLVEFFASHVSPAAASNAVMNLALNQDGAELDRYWCYVSRDTANLEWMPVHLQRRVTPSAGSHTFGVTGTVLNGNGYVTAGPGGPTQTSPAFLRVSKIVQQNDGLKPFWTPPIVTQLPSLATVGDQVIYAADATNGVYWQLQYDGLGTYPWKFIGGAPLSSSTTAGLGATVTSTSFVSATPDLLVSLGLPGEYWTTTTALATNNTAGAWWMLGVDGPGSAVTDQLCARVMQHSTGNWFSNGAASVKRTFTSSGTARLKYRVTAGVATVAERGFSLTPVRVKAA